MIRDPVAIPRRREERAEHTSRRVEVIGGLEERNQALADRAAGEMLKPLHGEHVGGLARHRDHVRAKRFAVDRRRCSKGFDGVADRFGRAGEGQIVDRTARAGESGQQHLLASFFGP